jgi:AcrR family transcriptional regulator
VSSPQSEQVLSPEVSPGGPHPKRRLRTSAEVRTLILEAAQKCFATSGYAGATTRQIAAEASVVENLIFTNFGNKEALFDAAIVEPFRAAIQKFVERLHERADHTPEFTTQEYISNLYDMLEGNAVLLIALMTDPRHEQPLLPFLEELERVGAYELGANGFTGVDLQVLVRCHFGMVAFNAAFGDQLYRPASGPSRERIKTEMAAILLGGTAYRSTDRRVAAEKS